MPLTKKDTVGTWIKDFKKSDAPQFKGKTDKEKRDMAVAAYLAKKREQKEDNIRSLEDPKRDRRGYKISSKRLNRHLRKTAQDVARIDKNMDEGLDELSKDKYGEYIKHATSDVSRRASRLSTDYSTKALNKLTKRQAGIHKAVDKLTKKESTEHPNCGTDDCCQQCDTAVVEEKHPALKRAGVQGFSKPKRTPGHPTKSHVVVVKDGSKVKTIRFGQQGAETAGDPKKGESDRMKKKRKSFKARHGKNIAKGKTSAAYWADKVKW